MNEYTQEQLKAAFDTVTEAMRDWKAPINTELGITKGKEDEVIPLVKAAVLHFTATEATVTVVGETASFVNVRVTATGYRMGPAGDH